MNIEQLKILSNTEINIQCAKILGYVESSLYIAEHGGVFFGNGRLNYAEDMNDAMMLVNVLRKREIGVELYFQDEPTYETCKLWTGKDYPFIEVKHSKITLAISLSALLMFVATDLEKGFVLDLA